MKNEPAAECEAHSSWKSSEGSPDGWSSRKAQHRSEMASGTTASNLMYPSLPPEPSAASGLGPWGWGEKGGWRGRGGGPAEVDHLSVGERRLAVVLLLPLQDHLLRTSVVLALQ